MKLRITIDEKTYDVDVEVAETEHAGLPPAYPVGSARLQGSAASAPAASVSGAAPLAPADEARLCRSPVSGIVVKVSATAGQRIEAGDSLVLLEAMKMETHITAPQAGTIAVVHARAGEHVQTGDVLVEFA